MTFCIGRREFITLLGGAAAWPLAARAQQPAMPVIGFLSSASPDGYATVVRAFRQGLKEPAMSRARTWRSNIAGRRARYDRLPALAADLVRRQVTVIAATSTPAALAAKAATTTIPIVFTTAGDPVRLGLVASLSRPGGNLTGVTTLNVEVGPKRLELLHELVPTATIIALLVNPTNPDRRDRYRETCRRRPAPSGCSSMSCMPAPNAIRLRSSQPWSNCGPARS